MNAHTSATSLIYKTAGCPTSAAVSRCGSFATARFLQGLPCGFSRGPQLFQMVLVPQRIHRLPETPVLEGPQLIAVRQPLQRILLERRGVPVDVFPDLRRQHE